MTRYLIGLSMGTSNNGVGAALVRSEGSGMDLTLRLEQHLHQPYGRDLRDLLVRVASEPLHAPRNLGMLHRVLGEAFANAARQVVERARMSLQQVLCVGLSGQIVWHDTESRYPATLSLGMPAIVAERTGLTTISDFRTRDVSASGQGSVLTALVDYLLLRHPQEHRLLVHLGGTATIVSLPPGVDPRGLVGFQAAPCMILLDGLMRLLTGGRESFDPGGKYAVQGCCVEPLVQRWLAHPLLKRKPPRSVPVHEFGADFLSDAVQETKKLGGSLHDLLCSATHFSARAIADAVRRFVPGTPTRLLVSGGGTRNGLLCRLLEQQFAPLVPERSDVVGIPAEARKPLAFAGLAALALDGVPTNVPAITGATGPRLLGSFTPGNSVNWARCLAWMAGQTSHLHVAA